MARRLDHPRATRAKTVVLRKPAARHFAAKLFFDLAAALAAMAALVAARCFAVRRRAPFLPILLIYPLTTAALCSLLMTGMRVTMTWRLGRCQALSPLLHVNQLVNVRRDQLR